MLKWNLGVNDVTNKKLVWNEEIIWRKLSKTSPISLKIASKVLMIIIGAFITAYGLEAVLIPNNVSDGGVTGLSIVSSRLFGLPLGL